MPTGAHKADLFRYYYLYLNGGIFIDSDFLVTSPDFERFYSKGFFTINSSYHPGIVFQGVIGCEPRHHIIKLALDDAYNIDISDLKNDYHLLCKNLYNIIFKYNGDDLYLMSEKYHSPLVAKVVHSNDEIFGFHFYGDKKIPDDFKNYLTLKSDTRGLKIFKSKFGEILIDNEIDTPALNIIFSDIDFKIIFLTYYIGGLGLPPSSGPI